MSKRDRGRHARRAADLYNTRDPQAVAPLLPFLRPGTRFIEPCMGLGCLATQLVGHGHFLVAAADIERRVWLDITPQYHADAARAFYLGIILESGAECFITNPPWTRPILHAIISNLAAQAPTWLLFDADWAFTRQAAPYLNRCSHIVAVGRVMWMMGDPEDKGMTPRENAAWYRFAADHRGGPRFYGRA